MCRIFDYWRGKTKVFIEIFLARLGFRRDLVGYEVLLDYLDKNTLWELDGDLLEIGAFMGGGTYKLAKRALQERRRVVVIDIFDPGFDQTVTIRAESMAWIYQKMLGGRNLRTEFEKTTSGLKNLQVYVQDSRLVHLPEDLELMFSFIDGNHSPEYVRNDFELAWYRTAPGGVVAFHDYGEDIPQVKSAVDLLIETYRQEIGRIATIHDKSIIFLHKNRNHESIRYR